MDKRLFDEFKQHTIDPLAAALDALGQDYNLMNSGRAVYTPAGLAIKTGGASPQFKTTNRIRYAISNVLYFQDPQAALSLPNPGVAVPVASSLVFLIQINAQAVVSALPGTIVLGANAPIPGPSLLNAAIGLISIQTNGSTTYQSGVTNLDAPGLTVDFVDFASIGMGLGYYPRLPASPFASASTLDGAPGPQPSPFNPQNY